ncbi:MAG: DUF58 domain-containing protein [Bdellovibrionota bacterium]
MIPQTFTAEYLKSLELLKLKSRRAFLGMREGGHTSIKRGHGIEFADYRKYEPGDDPRHIDWGVYARSDRLYLKRFREERDLSLLLLVDGTNSMFLPETDKKWEFARDLALSLAYIALTQQDAVTVAIPGKLKSPAYRGVKSFNPLCDCFSRSEPIEKSEFLRGVREAVSSVRFPGAVVYISDFLMPFEEIEQTLRLLRSKNLDITLIQVLGPSDNQPFENLAAKFIDAETNETINLVDTAANREKYSQLLNAHTEMIYKYCVGSQIGFQRVISDTDINSYIMTKLPITGILER